MRKLPDVLGVVETQFKMYTQPAPPATAKRLVQHVFLGFFFPFLLPRNKKA
ncbi:MAG TPA: hypothetical protein VND64_13495 [Pirellulales bacterium]|nr:hypothetical protein [Pirellulales bacterium]